MVSESSNRCPIRSSRANFNGPSVAIGTPIHPITGWRRNWPLFGKPDFTFPKLKLAVFVDGCFWHGCFWHGCPLHATQPKQNAAFWRKKIVANRTRDRFVTRTLRRLGWRVLRVWEHKLKRSHEHKLVRRLLTHLGRST